MARLRWLMVVGLSVLAISSVGLAETDAELVAKIDASVAKAVGFLAAKQSPDGAWRSDVYAPFKEGDALTPLLMTALLPLPMGDVSSASCERGIAYLVDLSNRTFSKEDGLKSLAYPVYSAANTVIVLHQRRRAEHDAIRAKWIEALRRLQFSELTGWAAKDIEYGGWGYGHSPVRKPKDGAMLGTLDQPNLSATAFALMALRIADGPTMSAAEFKRAKLFVERFQNEDGGFLFSRIDPTRNKAGKLEESKEQWNSYGAPTADGVRSLLNCGLDDESKNCRRGLGWLTNKFSADEQPGDFTASFAAARNGLYFYYVAAASQVLCETKTLQVERGVDWPTVLSTELLRRQAADGSWKNAIVDQREDDPLVATPFAIQALTACRAMLVDRR